jgi:O-methyltransferase
VSVNHAVAEQLKATHTEPELYIDLLKKCLSRYTFGENYRPLTGRNRPLRAMVSSLQALLQFAGLELVRHSQFDASARAMGLDSPPEAETMIGMERLNNLHECVVDVLRQGVPGDLIETGVWRGGACILMRGILKVYGDTMRTVWLADSFEGLPEPKPHVYAAETDPRLARGMFAAGLEQVKMNFRRYDLLDEQVRFLVGWFRDTLPRAPIEKLAILRLDGDLYESTMDALVNLYPKVSIGGYIIVDDYFLSCCRAAVDEFRQKQGIRETLLSTRDGMGAYWRRAR